ncbi:MAG: DUF411 domain-containing protein [Longimicrobiales bacterium]
MNVKILGAILVAAAGGFLFLGSSDGSGATLESIHVYKSPTCGCCVKWVEHLEDEGFDVTVEDVDDINAVKQQHGVPQDLSSCHTAIIGDYVIEGHVPASTISDLLAEAPDIHGLATPGMPIGSPGMEGPNPQPYDVMAFDAAGNRGVFERIQP